MPPADPIVYRLSAVCPPDARRPHLQEGFLIGRSTLELHDLMTAADGLDDLLVATFRLEDGPAGFWNEDFPRFRPGALLPDPRVDELSEIFAQILRYAVAESVEPGAAVRTTAIRSSPGMASRLPPRPRPRTRPARRAARTPSDECVSNAHAGRSSGAQSSVAGPGAGGRGTRLSSGGLTMDSFTVGAELADVLAREPAEVEELSSRLLPRLGSSPDAAGAISELRANPRNRAAGLVLGDEISHVLDADPELLRLAVTVLGCAAA